MKIRAAFLGGIMLLLWAFLWFIYLGAIGFNLLFSSLGIISGLVSGVAVAVNYPLINDVGFLLQ
ncbi:MAG: hypothetical protein ACUVTD_05125 [Nitrososphaerales archaeon]